MTKARVEIVPATATKLDGTGAIFVTIDPQFADFCQEIFDEVRRVVGHERIAVFPLPGGAIKFYSIKTDRQINVVVDPKLGINGLDKS